jgi:hypothetical protein
MTERIKQLIRDEADELGLGGVSISKQDPQSHPYIEYMVSVEHGSRRFGDRLVVRHTETVNRSKVSAFMQGLYGQITDRFSEMAISINISDTYTAFCASCAAEYTLPRALTRRLKRRNLSDKQRTLIYMILFRELQNVCLSNCLAKHERPIPNDPQPLFSHTEDIFKNE